MVVILLSILAFSLVGKQTPIVMVASRILLIPVIAAVGYELLRLGARHRSNPIVQGRHVARDPGPDDHDQAADRRHDRGRDRVASRRRSRADGDAIPEGGLELARDPMPKPGETAAGVRAAQEAADAEAAAPVSIDPPLAG